MKTKGTKGTLVRAVLFVVAILLLTAGEIAHAQSTYCLPSCSTTDGRSLSLAGSRYKSIIGDQIELSLAVPGGTDSIRFEIFDGETGGIWDYGTVSVVFRLYADPSGDGSGTTLVGKWRGSVMSDNGWYWCAAPTNSGAISESGWYYYMLEARLEWGDTTDAGEVEDDAEDSVASVTWSNFKIRTPAILTSRQFAFCTPIFSLNEAQVIYPGWPSLTGSTYDGTWKFFFNVLEEPTSIEVWDGDMDYGSYDGSRMDVDDPNTSGTALPSWAGSNAVAEGVAVGTDFVRNADGSLSSTLSTGTPQDDNANPIYRRTPSPYYEVVDPNGRTYTDTNVSGNREWERFVVGVGANSAHDTNTTYLPRGVYQVRLYGVDAHNLNAFRYGLGIVGTTTNDTVPNPPSPSCATNAGGGGLGRGTDSKSIAIVDVDGNIYAWGDNCTGQLGDSILTTDQKLPTAVHGGDYSTNNKLGGGCGGVLDFAISHLHMVATMHGGEVYAWGDNSNGVLGTVSTASNVLEPSGVVKGAYPGTTLLGDNWQIPILHVAAGEQFSAAVAGNGLVYTWGANGRGQLGNNTTTNSTSPIRVLKGAYNGTTYLGDNGNNPMVDVVTSNYSTYALAADGTVWSWGDNASGSLGDNTTTDRRTPVKVLKGSYPGSTYLGDNPANPIIALAPMKVGCMAIAASGLVYTWGENGSGQLGDGTKTDRLVPVTVVKGAYAGTTYLGDQTSNKVIMVAGGAIHSMALTASGQVFAWGGNSDGQLGDNTTTQRSTPIRVIKGAYTGTTYLGDSSQVITAIAAERAASYAWAAGDGTAYAWGFGAEGRLGQNSTTDYRYPVVVMQGERPSSSGLSVQSSGPGNSDFGRSHHFMKPLTSAHIGEIMVTGDMVSMRIDLSEETDISVKVFSAEGVNMGDLLSGWHARPGSSWLDVQLPPTLPRGIYFVQVTWPGGNTASGFQYVP